MSIHLKAVAQLGRQDSNLRMPGPKPGALPLGHAPIRLFPSLVPFGGPIRAGIQYHRAGALSNGTSAIESPLSPHFSPSRRVNIARSERPSEAT